MTMMRSRRRLLSAAAASALLPATAAAGVPVRRDAVEERGLADLAAELAAGRTSARALVAAYTARIARLDRHGPQLRSVIELNPDALAIAAALDDERRARGPRGPLHGVPILIKDNIATRDRMQTTAGSLALVGSRPRADAGVVQRLRAAGAVILGKTNLSEWANIRSPNSTSGWSARGGLARNPYALDRNTSGSSSGSAAAAAASLCAAAVGTETDGSILSPSSICGLVGLKPTLGLVSTQGVIPIAPSQDTVGPMARSVRDAALLLGAMVETPFDYAAALDASALRGARLGVVRDYLGAHPGSDAVFEAALRALAGAGATLVDPVSLSAIAAVGDDELTVLLYELKASLNAYLAALETSPVRTLADVIAYNERHAARELRWFGQEFLVKAQATGTLSDAAYLDARARCLKAADTDGLSAQLATHRLDAFVGLTSAPAWRTDLVRGDRLSGPDSFSPAAIAGFPSVTVPAGLVEGLPVGISLFGAARSEPKLLGYAYAFEQATRARRAPRYLPHAEGS